MMKNWMTSLSGRDWNRSVLTLMLALAAVFLTGSLHPEHSQSPEEVAPARMAVEALRPEVPLARQGAWERAAAENPLLLFRCSVGDYR